MSEAINARPSCVAGHEAVARFRFLVPGGHVDKCLRHAMVHARLVRTAILTALVVGSILTLINQGNLLLAGTFRGDMAWKIPMTYSVPYMVVTWSALRTSALRS